MKLGFAIVAVLLVALIVVTQPESSRRPSTTDPPTTSPPARVSSVFYVNGNLCPEVMTHAECKERLGK
jgi:hypothetical protein